MIPEHCVNREAVASESSVPASEGMPRITTITETGKLPQVFRIKKSEKWKESRSDRVGQNSNCGARITSSNNVKSGRELRRDSSMRSSHDYLRQCRYPASIADGCWPILLRYVSEDQTGFQFQTSLLPFFVYIQSLPVLVLSLIHTICSRDQTINGFSTAHAVLRGHL